MFFVVRSNDSFNFPLGLIKYIVIIVTECCVEVRDVLVWSGIVSVVWSSGVVNALWRSGIAIVAWRSGIVNDV